jgi:hypothetical protein
LDGGFVFGFGFVLLGAETKNCQRVEQLVGHSGFPRAKSVSFGQCLFEIMCPKRSQSDTRSCYAEENNRIRLLNTNSNRSSIFKVVAAATTAAGATAALTS